MISLAPELTSFIYDECIMAGRAPSTSCLKTLIPKLLTAFKDIRMMIDGIDEVEHSQHRELINTVTSFTDNAEMQGNCKILFSSQNIPSILSNLRNKPELSLGAESASIADDLKIFVTTSLEELNDIHDGAISKGLLSDVQASILERAEGMIQVSPEK